MGPTIIERKNKKKKIKKKSLSLYEYESAAPSYPLSFSPQIGKTIHIIPFTYNFNSYSFKSLNFSLFINSVVRVTNQVITVKI